MISWRHFSLFHRVLNRSACDGSRRLGSEIQSRLSSTGSSTIYSFGNGTQGALGCGSSEDNYESEYVHVLENVAGIAAGHYHSIAWTAAGRLFSWGRNQELQLGRPTEPDDEHYGIDASPGLVKGMPKQVQVVNAAASGVATLVVDADGRLHAFGRSKRGQLGLGRGSIAAGTPDLVSGLEGVVSVSCGWGHALALTEEGQVWSWGYPAANRLGNFFGQGDTHVSEQQILEACVWTPHRIRALSGIKAKQVCCSLDSSLVVAEDGRLFTFGDNSLAQLGRAHDEAAAERSADDWLVKKPDGTPLHVHSVAAGLGHCLAITTDGEVLVWGWNHGLKDLPDTQQLPASVPGITPGRPSMVAAGRVHSLVATDAALLSFGNGQNGRLGTGTSQSSAVPEVVPGLENLAIQQLACGHDHSLVLTRG